jgi:D-alanyl-D-alanine carboxypeptidase (penicillin-binding protein 5/6)
VKKAIVFTIIFMFLFNYSLTFAEVAPAPSLTSEAVVVTSADYGQPIYQLNADKRFSPGALTQALVGIIVLEKFDPEATVTIGDVESLVNPTDVNLGISQGDTLSVKQLIQAMMIGSYDDASNALALFASDDNYSEFISDMNKRATELGCINSHFVNPTGTTDDNQYSTAADMAKIYLKAYSMPTLKAILCSKTASVYDVPIRTNNYLFDNYLQTKYYYGAAAGGKAGYKGTSVCNLVSFAQSDGTQLMSVIMGGTKVDDVISTFPDAKSVLQWGFDNYSTAKAAKLGEIITQVKVRGGKNQNTVPLVANDELNVLVTAEDKLLPDSNIQKVINAPAKISAPVSKGQKIGTVDYIFKGEKVQSVNLVAATDLKATAWGSFINLFSNKAFTIIFCVLVLGGIIYFAFVGPHLRRTIRKRERQRRIEEKVRRNPRSDEFRGN